jgi:hypothetical protein
MPKILINRNSAKGIYIAANSDDAIGTATVTATDIVIYASATAHVKSGTENSD